MNELPPSLFPTGQNKIDQHKPRLRPQVKAALLAGLFVIILEILTTLLPGFGYVITLPFAVGIYFTQGLMTTWLARQDEHFIHSSPWKMAGLGALSAVWTSAVISPLVTVGALLLLTPVSMGAILFELPWLVLASLADLLLNLLFTSFGAWLFARGGTRLALTGACLAMGLGVALACLAGSGLLVGLGIQGWKIIQTAQP